MVRDGNYLLQGARLFQQYLVVAYCKIETERLQFLRCEQKALGADSYISLRDSILAIDGDPRQVGQRVVLPATYTGGPRYMHERQSDAMAYVRRMGRADFFITMTCNPQWPEIADNLLPGQQAQDRPDMVARVFRQKHKKLMELIVKEAAFGKVRAWLYSIEYQKRGLPHAHILTWQDPQYKIRPEEIDLVIAAEIPDKDKDPQLHKLVLSHMIHGPCGAINMNSPCMVDRQCTKHFPKTFLQCTEQGIDSYPKYRRRKPEDGGHTGNIKMLQRSKCINQEVTNQWVVPYNPLLLREFNCHINVELCSSINSIKYVLKYVTKGTDQAVFELQRTHHDNEQQTDQPRVVDEIALFQNARYVGSCEAAWRILEHPTHDHFPPVVGLAVHLQNGQRVIFTEANAMNIAQGPPPATTLTAFFELCNNDIFAKTLKYADVPEYYTWNRSTKKWIRRKRGVPLDGNDPRNEIWRAPAIGRIYTVSPRAGECYFLRMLLNEVTGPTSFENLRTVNNHVCNTFREACHMRGLL